MKTATKSNKYKNDDIPRPRRALTAYNLFFRDQKMDLVEKQGRGAISFEEMGKIIGARWKAITPQEKAPYDMKASVYKEQYKKEMEQYSRALISVTPHKQQDPRAPESEMSPSNPQGGAAEFQKHEPNQNGNHDMPVSNVSNDSAMYFAQSSDATASPHAQVAAQVQQMISSNPTQMMPSAPIPVMGGWVFSLGSVLPSLSHSSSSPHFFAFVPNNFMAAGLQPWTHQAASTNVMPTLDVALKVQGFYDMGNVIPTYQVVPQDTGADNLPPPRGNHSLHINLLPPHQVAGEKNLPPPNVKHLRQGPAQQSNLTRVYATKSSFTEARQSDPLNLEKGMAMAPLDMHTSLSLPMSPSLQNLLEDIYMQEEAKGMTHDPNAHALEPTPLPMRAALRNNASPKLARRDDFVGHTFALRF